VRSANPLSTIEAQAIWRLAGLAPTLYIPGVLVSANGLYVDYVQSRLVLVCVDQVAEALGGPDAEIIREIMSRSNLCHSKLADVCEADKTRHQARSALDDVLAELKLSQ